VKTGPSARENLLDTIAARLALGRIRGDELPRLAIQLLTAGYDSLPLRELAGETTATLHDWSPRFASALAHAGAASLTRDQAKSVLVRATSADIVAGRVTPEAGATQLATLWIEFPTDRDLGRYYALADDWLEYPEQRDALTTEIHLHARAIVERAVSAAR
jgi:hypothetical protein